MINITKLLIFLKLGCSCVLILHRSAGSIFALHKTNKQERPTFGKEG